MKTQKRKKDHSFLLKTPITSSIMKYIIEPMRPLIYTDGHVLPFQT